MDHQPMPMQKVWKIILHIGFIETVPVHRFYHPF